MRGPVPRKLVVAAEHLEILRTNLRTGKTEHRVVRRSQILLLRASGLHPSRVAQRVGCDRSTVWRVEERYRERDLAALHDAPRPGRPSRLSPPPASPRGRVGLSQAR